MQVSSSTATLQGNVTPLVTQPDHQPHEPKIPSDRVIATACQPSDIAGGPKADPDAPRQSHTVPSAASVEDEKDDPEEDLEGHLKSDDLDSKIRDILRLKSSLDDRDDLA